MDFEFASARFYLAGDFGQTREFLHHRPVEWVFAYDSDRVGQNSAVLLGLSIPDRPIGRILDQTPAQAPGYLILVGRNGTAKLFRFADKL